MRDLILVIFLFAAVYYTFKRPVVGVSAWIWIALIAPTNWTFGFSQIFRLNLSIVLVTVLSYLVWKNKPKFKFTNIHFWVLLFGFWTFISTLYSLTIDSALTWNKFNEFMKVLVLFLFITLTLKTKKDIEAFIWAIVLGLSAYAAMEAVKFVLSGGGHRIIGRAGIIADRNDLAVAINMCLPLIAYLWSITKDKWLKYALLTLIVLNVIAIIGTYSRGGFIGLSILAFAMWLKSDRKILYVAFAIIMLPVLYANAPQDWKDRQSTVETAASTDSSFIGRLWAWKIATLIALDNPLTGGGLKATSDPSLWFGYAPLTPDFGPIETPPIPLEIRPKAAHNIYFQVLANSGFIGLILFLTMLITSYLRIRKCSKNATANNIIWQSNLSKAITLSFIGYGITGLNVSLAYFELLYAFLALIVVISLYEHRESNHDPKRSTTT